jgi:hypothetical protein
MQDIGIEQVFNLLAFAIRKRKPHVSGEMPTFEDLEAEVQRLWASETPKAPLKVEVFQSGTPATSEKITGVATSCVPCSIGHLGTCTGLLNEAMRFARNDGIDSEEVINRVNMCVDELNALERVDLRPELIYGLPDWEKTLAEEALELSRTVRHGLEGLSNVPDLEGIAAKTQGTRQEIGKTWFRERLRRMTPEQRQMVEQKLQKKFNLDQAKKVAAEAATKEIEERWNSQEKK